MAAVPSTMLPLGTVAPDFTLASTEGTVVRLADFSAKALVVMFISNHCPYVKHLHAGILAFAKDYADRSLDIVAISSNNPLEYPEDCFEKMISEKRDAGFSFPYLFDETQAIAKAYRAACTPDFFLFDAERKLRYRGQFCDGRRKTENPVTGKDLRAAVDAVLAGKPVPEVQKPSIGCNIKWKPGNEPDYFGKPISL
jgi:peroxiredoxin